MKIKQLFCKHKKVDYCEPVTAYHALNSNPIYHFCADCGKLLKIEYISNEEYLFRFRLDGEEKPIKYISKKGLLKDIQKLKRRNIKI